jgi:F-type H+-transporting ATPase subunit a
MDGGLHISLAAERLFSVGGVPVTNSLITAWVVSALLILVAVMVGRNPALIPGKLQNVFEMMFEYLLTLMEQTLGTRALAIRYFPLVATIFLFIFVSNMFDFLPVFGTFNFTGGGSPPAGGVPLFRAVNTDLNFPLALAIIAFLVIELSGILTLGVLKYGSKFVNFNTGVVGFLVGLVELIGNLARLISLSFRLFGNVLAGEVLLLVIGTFVPYIAPLPFLAFEIFIGFLQSAIFALLTLAFIKLAIEEPHLTSSGQAHA